MKPTIYCPIAVSSNYKSFDIINTPIPTFDIIGTIKPTFTDNDSYISYLGDCITFQMSREVELLATCIDMFIIEYSSPVNVLQPNSREMFLNILTNSQMFECENFIRGTSKDPESYFNANINQILTDIISLIDVYANVVIYETKYHVMDIGNIVTLIRELVRTTVYKIVSYIENSFR